ncbi:MAG: GIY-YIG nuclease family protein [Bacteroidia bacterium]|nr:GIY-YIG nuclease family protein [Bacteroidia bacterium]
MSTFFVYIIYSPSRGIYYKGFSEDPVRRLQEHHADKSRYTSGKGPWEMVYLKNYSTKREALIAEKKIKRAGSEYLHKLIREYQAENS